MASVRADGTGLDDCGYIEGSETDRGSGVAVGAAGNAYVAGETGSTETTVPVKVGPDLSFNGSRDVFVAMRPDGTCPSGKRA